MKDDPKKLNEANEHLIRLHEQCGSLMLATVGESLPRASYAPYVRDAAGDFYIYVSLLSPHTADLIANPIASVLIIEDESGAKQVFARMRASYLCGVETIHGADPSYPKILEQMAQRFGNVVQLLQSLPDFVLFRLSPRSGRFVTGFGQAYDLAGDRLDRLAPVGKD